MNALRVVSLIAISVVVALLAVLAARNDAKAHWDAEMPATAIKLNNSTRCYILVIDRHFYLVNANGGLVEIPPIIDFDQKTGGLR